MPVRIRGRVLDRESDRPIEGAAVEIFGQVFETDGHGRFDATAAQVAYLFHPILTAVAPGRATAGRLIGPVEVDEPLDVGGLELRLGPGRRVAGRVVVDGDGLPVAGTEVRLRTMLQNQGPGPVQAFGFAGRAVADPGGASRSRGSPTGSADGSRSEAISAGPAGGSDPGSAGTGRDGLRIRDGSLAPGSAHMISMISMAQLIVRNLDDELVRRLKIRAALKGRSMEAEHREILQEALRGEPPRRGFKDLLLAIPEVGEDSDFERPRDLARPVEL